MDNIDKDVSNDERRILYEGAERRRMICAENELVDRLIDTLNADRDRKSGITNPTIIIPIVFSVGAALFTFIWTINEKTTKLEYKYETLQKNFDELKTEIKEIHKQIDSIEISMEHLMSKQVK